jgi:hypothetical protein
VGAPGWTLEDADINGHLVETTFTKNDVSNKHGRDAKTSLVTLQKKVDGRDATVAAGASCQDLYLYIATGDSARP